MKSRRINSDGAPRFKERVRTWAVKLRVEPRQIRMQKMARKWMASQATKVKFPSQSAGDYLPLPDRVLTPSS